MAQTINISTQFPTTVDFSIVALEEFFIYNGQLCKILDNNNPNYVVLSTGVVDQLASNDQVILPDNIDISAT